MRMTKISHTIPTFDWLFYMILAKIMPTRIPKACQSTLTSWAFFCPVNKVVTQDQQVLFFSGDALHIYNMCPFSFQLELTWDPITENHSWKEVQLPRKHLLFMDKEVAGKEMWLIIDTQMAEPELEPGDQCSSLLPLGTLALIYPFCCSEKRNLKT